GLFLRELDELVQQLETYPSAVLLRPEQVPAKEGRKPRTGQRLSLEVANKKVTEYLKKNPKAKSREIAQAIGCSEGQVRGTPAWQAGSERRKEEAGVTRPRREEKGLGKRIGLDIAVEKKAVEREKEEKRSEQEEEYRERAEKGGDREHRLA